MFSHRSRLAVHCLANYLGAFWILWLLMIRRIVIEIQSKANLRSISVRPLQIVDPGCRHRPEFAGLTGRRRSDAQLRLRP